MKKFYTLILTGVFITSCGNNNAGQPEADNDSASTINYTWQASLNDSSGKLEMKKVEAADLDSLSASSIIAFINKSDSSIHLDFVKASNDTVYLKIPEATFLTQQMGSTGPSVYMAGVVYNLTELPGIKYVNFDFEEGDHAAPGTFTRDSFKNE